MATDKHIRVKWLREITEEAQRQGFRVKVTSKCHVLFLAPDGVGTAMATPNDTPRHRRNILADLKRLGFKIGDTQ